MQYLCTKQLTVGGTTYYPRDIIPDGAILPGRSRKLIRSGYLSEMSAEADQTLPCEKEKMFTQEKVTAMIADAVAEAVREKEAQLAKLQEHAAELVEMDSIALEVFENTVPVTVFGDKSDMAIRLFPEEIQQVFSIMQRSVDEGAKAISDITSENVLILLHASDSRKTIKNAAKERADKLFSTKGDSNESSGGNEAAGTNTEGS